MGNVALHEADSWSWITPPRTLNSTQCPESCELKKFKTMWLNILKKILCLAQRMQDMGQKLVLLSTILN